MLKDIYKENKIGIAFGYLLFFVEFSLFAFLPWIFGKAIDQLIKHDFKLFFIYITFCFVGLCIGFFRRRLDTRIFLGIWKSFTTKAVFVMLDKNIETSKITSRQSLISNYSNFFENILPLLVSNFLNLIIALGMMFITSYFIGFSILFISLFGLFISFFYASRMQHIEKDIQEDREHVYAAIVERNKDSILQKYTNIVAHFVKRSDMQASLWSFTDVLSTSSEILIVYTLLVSNTNYQQASEMIGIIMATTMYNSRIWQAIGQLSFLFVDLKNLEVADEILKKDN